MGIRSASNGYGGDSVRQKFGSKERDSETGLDFFEIRYLASIQGRFTSPDSFTGFAANPQTLNLYAYVQNNPLRFTDPTGHLSQEPPDLSKKLMDLLRKTNFNGEFDKRRRTGLVYKDWKKEEGKDPQGRPIVTYTWVDDPNVHDVPDNHRYIDVNGNFIQLWSWQGNHGWQYTRPTADGPVYEDQPGSPPSSFTRVEDTAAALNKAGYVEHYLDPLHNGRQFSLPTSPTFHVTVAGEISVKTHYIGEGGGSTVVSVAGSGPISSVDFHYDSHTQAGSWGSMFRHLWDAVRGKP